jgi:hypothetical protein
MVTHLTVTRSKTVNHRHQEPGKAYKAFLLRFAAWDPSEVMAKVMADIPLAFVSVSPTAFQIPSEHPTLWI